MSKESLENLQVIVRTAATAYRGYCMPEDLSVTFYKMPGMGAVVVLFVHDFGITVP